MTGWYRIKNRKDVEGNGLGVMKVPFRNSGTEWGISVKIVDIPAEIRTENFLSISHKCYLLIQFAQLHRAITKNDNLNLNRQRILKFNSPDLTPYFCLSRLQSWTDQR
jgi:hypothetical protein